MTGFDWPRDANPAPEYLVVERCSFCQRLSFCKTLEHVIVEYICKPCWDSKHERDLYS